MTKKLKSEELVMKFSGLWNLEDLRLSVYTDASHANLPDGASSASGHDIFLEWQNDSCCILSWSSHKVRRVVKSTVVVKGLALMEDGVYMEVILSDFSSRSKE